MRVLIAVQHPAHVHFYRHAIDELERAGHTVRVVARAKDVATDLLSAYDIPYEELSQAGDSLAQLALGQLRYEARLLSRARSFQPDVLTAVGGLSVAHVGWLLGIPSVAFIDNEGVASTRATVPFADVVCTPRGLRSDYGDGHRRYDGYHELAYLHPDRFQPEPDRLRAFGVEPDERYFVCRFVGWGAHHDVGQSGLSRAGMTRLVDTLADRGPVYITTEEPLPDRFERHRLPVPPELIHDLLAGAALYAGDSQTMATEAAVLGTPAVRSNSFAGGTDMSNFVDLETRYGLLYSRGDERTALRLVERLADDPDAGAEWARRRARLLADTVDVTAYVVATLCDVAGVDPPAGMEELACGWAPGVPTTGVGPVEGQDPPGRIVARGED
jgi:predicted glycosyltransferase